LKKQKNPDECLIWLGSVEMSEKLQDRYSRRGSVDKRRFALVDCVIVSCCIMLLALLSLLLYLRPYSSMDSPAVASLVSTSGDSLQGFSNHTVVVFSNVTVSSGSIRADQEIPILRESWNKLFGEVTANISGDLHG